MFYLIMGVSGSGKSTIGKIMSDRLNCSFYDADDFHPLSNIQKMNQGIPLTDSDRLPWLLKLHETLKNAITKGQTGVMACSALTEKYRQIIVGNYPNQVVWIYLKGDYLTICDRMRQRQNHFFQADLLKSQFDILEEPENALVIDISWDLNTIITKILHLSDTSK